MLINPYSPEVKFTNFPDLDSRLLTHYDRLFHSVNDFEISPRYVSETGLKIGYRDIFYYIDYLYNNQPTSIVDVGCGECVWKNWFPNIIGFDPVTNEFSKQDFIDTFDEDFSKGHTKNWDSGMALNSIHFVHWNELPRQIELAMNIVKDQFLFTFNFKMIQNKPFKTQTRKQSSRPDLPMDELISAFDDLLKSLPYKIILLDYPIQRGISLTKLNHWGFLNGHVRFILQHINEQ